GGPVDPVHEQAGVGGGTVGQLVDVDLGVQVLPTRENTHHAGGSTRCEGVAEVVGGVLLRAGQGRSEDRQQRQQVGEHQAAVGDVTGGALSLLVADHGAQRLGVAAVAAYLEHVGVDDHVASETVTDGEGVDGTAAHHHVRVGRLAHPELLGGLDDHPVPLG